MQYQHDLVVIGAGPGGYIAALRAAQLGFNVGVIEKEPFLGGTCLRVGCIPSKALLEASDHYHQARHGLASFGLKIAGVEMDIPAMLARKTKIVAELARGIEELFKRGKITRYAGHGRFTGPLQVEVVGAAEPTTLTAGKFIIATGSKVAPLRGITIDHDRIGTSTEALEYPSVPKHLVVIGAGAIGLELGSVWCRLGAKVTVLEYLDRILPEMDADIAKEALRIFKKQGLEFRLGSRVTGATVVGDQVTVTCDGADPVVADRVLVAVGRVPNTENLGLDTLGIALDNRGRIPVDDHFQTPAPGIYAIGDVIRGPMLAHKAEEEGVAIAEYLATGYGHVNYNVIPGVVYTNPEVASVGKTEETLKSEGIPFRKGTFPFRNNGRAKIVGHTDGLVKILAHAETDRLLGVHIVGVHAGDLIAEAAVAMEFGASAEDLARACHAHPTLPEVLKEAALAVDGRTLNG